MSVDADAAAGALIDAWEHLVAEIPDGWSRRRSGILAAVTGVAVPTLNGVWVARDDAESGTIADLLDEVAASGLPHCLQSRPGAAQQADGLAGERGMRRDEIIPLMVLQRPSSLPSAPALNGLVIRTLEPHEAGLHATVAADGFEAPAEPFLQLMTPSLLAAPGVRCYIGEVDGVAVTTGLGVTIGTSVGIFNIATPPAHRRRGYGAAVTVRAISDGLAAGATWSWLQASRAGLPVYERLGFRTVEGWRSWVSVAARPAS
jgi:GNAT superfamily N-acetyltransferase